MLFFIAGEYSIVWLDLYDVYLSIFVVMNIGLLSDLKYYKWSTGYSQGLGEEEVVFVLRTELCSPKIMLKL